MPEHRTTDSGSSLLRSPKASDGAGGALGEAEALKRGNSVGIRDQVMDLAASQGMKVSRADLLPTPNTMDNLPPREGEAYELNLRRGDPDGTRREMSGNLREAVIHSLLPTPIVLDYKDGSQEVKRNDVVQVDTVGRAVMNSGEITGTTWGKFEPAIRKWESVLGRAAPAPTLPDGKDGAHRLSHFFTEWMMGLSPGWVTGCGLSRNEMLKACGNGVVPQQARLALSILLEGMAGERERERITMFPTPTVSDTFTDNLSSTQQKQGSMHSVTLPQAVRMIDHDA